MTEKLDQRFFLKKRWAKNCLDKCKFIAVISWTYQTLSSTTCSEDFHKIDHRLKF